METKANNVISDNFCVHFNTEEHRILIDVFVTTAGSIHNISKEINQKLFNNKLTPEIYIIPAENGGFIEWLNFQMINHPAEIIIGKFLVDFILKRISDKDLTEWAKEVLGTTWDEGIKELEKIKNDTENFVLNTEIAFKLYLYTITKFLFSDTLKLKQWNINPQDFPSAFIAKNKFYETCLQPNNGIKGIGYTKEHSFPVKRNEFTSYMTKVHVDDDVHYKLQKIIITNPTIVDSDDPWIGRNIIQNKKIKFNMDDIYFKQLIMGGQCPIKSTNQDDEMIAYFEYRTIYQENMKTKQIISAKKVYQYNDRIFDDIPNTLQLDHDYDFSDTDQPNLFSKRNS